MNKEEFIKLLESDNVSIKDKELACIYYIENYPVVILQQGNIFKPPIEIETALDINLTTGASTQIIEHGFNQLVKRLNELKTLK